MDIKYFNFLLVLCTKSSHWLSSHKIHVVLFRGCLNSLVHCNLQSKSTVASTEVLNSNHTICIGYNSSKGSC